MKVHPNPHDAKMDVDEYGIIFKEAQKEMDEDAVINKVEEKAQEAQKEVHGSNNEVEQGILGDIEGDNGEGR